MNAGKPDRKKLRVAHFMPWSGIGGVEVATLRMADATREQFQHIAFCLRDAAELIKSFENKGFETVIYSPPDPSLRHAAQFFRRSLSVASQIRKAKADIVHFADEKAAYHNSLAAFLARPRTICHIRSTIDALSLRQKLCLLPIQSFIFVSKESRRSFALPLPDSKARVIYDSVDIQDSDMTESNAAVRNEFNIPSTSALVGMVARVAPVKDYFTLAAAAVEVIRKHPDSRFLIVGDNSLIELNRNHYQNVVQKLKDLGVADAFIFTGHRSDVTGLIAAMDVFVLSTHREGFPLSILEAMAMRKPVVATAVGGIPEIVEPGITGYLHEHQNSKELARAINFLIENPAKANAIGAAALSHVRANYSRQLFVDDIVKAYSDLLHR